MMKAFYQHEVEWYEKQVEWYKGQIAWYKQHLPFDLPDQIRALNRARYRLRKYRKKLAEVE